MVFTELRPSCTCARAASPVVGSSLNRPTVLCSWPNAGRPTYRTLSRRSSSIVPSTLRSGRAPRGSSPSSATSTVTVPFCAAGSMRMTLPAMMPLRVSTEAIWPIVRSRACVSAMRSSALSRVGIGDAREVGAGRHLLADFDRHLLEHAGHAGAHAQLIDLLAAQVEVRAALIDARLLRLQLRLDARLGHLQALLFDLVARRRAIRRAPSTACSIRFETRPSLARPSFISLLGLRILDSRPRRSRPRARWFSVSASSRAFRLL